MCSSLYRFYWKIIVFYNSGSHGIRICYVVSQLLVCVFVSVNECLYVGEGLRRSFATPNPFVLINKICLNQSESLPGFD